MTPEALEALKGSIEKWRRIVEEGSIDHGDEDCPLCRIFSDEYCGECTGCPVEEATGFSGCIESPYIKWLSHGGKFSSADTLKKMSAAKEELEFLRSLLPAETK